MSVDVAVPELAVTSLPRLLACRPWQAASGSSGNCITVTAGNHRPHIGEQGRVLVFRQQFWWALRFFLREKELTTQLFVQNMNDVLAPARELQFSAG